MPSDDIIRLALFLLTLTLLIKPVGMHIYRVLTPNERTFLDPILKPIETKIYALCRIDHTVEHSWKSYLACIVGFSLMSIVFTMLLLGMQGHLPLNTQNLAAPSWHLNLNVAISFMTNTNWQSYSGESTMSYFSQMTALAVQNFASAAVGLATAAALVRGIARHATATIGNFWVDLVRISLYLLLPLSLIASALLLSEGTPQNFQPYVQVETLEGGVQTIVQGPIASQEAVKLLGTNGGGFTNTNSAHPYENPTPFSNFLQLLMILLLPGAQIYYFGRCINNTKHAWCIFSALAVIFIAGAVLCTDCELKGNPGWMTEHIAGGNFEGKETRFGIFGSTLYACATTAVSCGSVNCMHDSLTPIGGLVPMLNIQLSEVIFGGIGAGLYSVLLFVFLAIFIAGLIIGRTPEYLGKKIEAYDIKMTVFAIIPYVLIVHSFTAWACFTTWGQQGPLNGGPHGFSEILYAFSSCGANNGSAFAGLSSNSMFYNLTLGAVMLFGRFLVIAPVMALAGSLAEKKVHPQNAGSFPVSSPVFISLLAGVILLLGALTFLPPLTIGPIVEQFRMLKGTIFT